MAYRCYVFVHSFLGSIHKGVQAAHAVAELVQKYHHEGSDKQTFAVGEWVRDDKTLLILEGGNSANMRQIEQLAIKSHLPYAAFREDDDTLDCILTAVAVVVCESSLEKYKSKLRTKDTLQKRIVSARLAV